MVPWCLRGAISNEVGSLFYIFFPCFYVDIGSPPTNLEPRCPLLATRCNGMYFSLNFKFILRSSINSHCRLYCTCLTGTWTDNKPFLYRTWGRHLPTVRSHTVSSIVGDVKGGSGNLQPFEAVKSDLSGQAPGFSLHFLTLLWDCNFPMLIVITRKHCGSDILRHSGNFPNSNWPTGEYTLMVVGQELQF